MLNSQVLQVDLLYCKMDNNNQCQIDIPVVNDIDIENDIENGWYDLTNQLLDDSPPELAQASKQNISIFYRIKRVLGMGLLIVADVLNFTDSK